MDSTASLPTSTIQLRRYQIEPGRVADHVKWFPEIKAAREKYGYAVLFAVADAEHNTFTWAVEFDGDLAEFQAAEKVYEASDERAAAFGTNPMVVTALELAFVDNVLA